MELKKGITIDNQFSNGYDAITINSGAVHYTKQAIPVVNYHELSYTPQYVKDAYVTKRDWRKLNRKEIKCLQSSSIKKRKNYNTVYLGEIPEDLKKSFEKLNLKNSVHRNDVLKRFSSDETLTLELSNAISNFLKPISQNKPFNFHTIGVNVPNLEMVGCDTTKLPSGFAPKDVKYLGIHFDRSQKITFRRAFKAGNRISINLGDEPRYFLFVNLSAIQVLNMLKKKVDIKKHNINIHNIAKYFFKNYPNYPVIRVKLLPYQYYIAPTDNCFHDGSTIDKTKLDISIIYFGSFQY